MHIWQKYHRIDALFLCSVRYGEWFVITADASCEQLIKVVSAGFLPVKLTFFPLMSILWEGTLRLLNIAFFVQLSVYLYIGFLVSELKSVLLIIHFEVQNIWACPTFDCWEPCLDGSSVLSHVSITLSSSLFSDTTTHSCLILLFPYSSLNVSHFFKVLWFLLVENGI